MYKIAFHIQKGGVGKTTLSGNMGYSLALKGKKTVLIDVDPQGSLSTWFLSNAPAYELASVLNEKTDVSSALVKLNDNLWIIPTFGLEVNLKDFSETQLFRKPNTFSNLVKELAKLDFEFAIFDLSPGMSLLEMSVIAAMNEVITPLTPEYFSLDGIEIFTNHLKRINKDYEKSVKHRRIVINNINHSFRRHNTVLEAIQKKDYLLYTIAQDAKIAESQQLQKPIFYYPSSKTIAEFDRLADDLIGA